MEKFLQPSVFIMLGVALVGILGTINGMARIMIRRINDRPHF
jgi:hypothetical protein